MSTDKKELLRQLEIVNKQIETKNKQIIKLLQIVKCDKVDFYSIINDVDYLKHKKSLILFELASK